MSMAPTWTFRFHQLGVQRLPQQPLYIDRPALLEVICSTCQERVELRSADLDPWYGVPVEFLTDLQLLHHAAL